MRRIILGLFAAVLATACQRKDLPLPENTEPIFRFSGTLDGQQIQLYAGKDGYTAESKLGQDPFGLFYYSGSLASSCVDCPPEISISIRSQDYYAPGNSLPVSSDLGVGIPEYFEFPVIPLPFMGFDFNAFEQDSGLTYQWDFGDGETSAEMNPFHVYAFPGEYQVTLSLSNAEGACGSVSQTILAGTPGNCSCPFRIITSGTECSFTTTIMGSQNVVPLQWIVSDEFGIEACIQDIENPEDLELTCNTSTIHPYSVCLDSYNDALMWGGKYCANIDPLSPAGIRDAGFGFISTDAIPYLDQVSVSLFHDGQLYVSDLADNSSGYFEVVASEPYSDPFEGFEVRKLRILFSCSVANVDNPDEQILLENCEAILPFSEPM